MDPGETAAEACTREVFEETGYETAADQLIGAYSFTGLFGRVPAG